MIPNILWQTWKTNEIPKSLKKQTDSWDQSNPQLNRCFFDDQECSKFILKHFGEEAHRLYLALPQPIMRADFWRVAVVYIHGGYYSDLDIICNTHINDLIMGSPSAVFIYESNNIANFFFGAEPNHPVIKQALDYMIEEAKFVTDKNVQSFGMHSLHLSVKEYYKVVETNYVSNDEVFFISNKQIKNEKKFIHANASLLNNDKDYISWRSGAALMNQEREESQPILFFTTFNKNGYELYGKQWIQSFIVVANYYNKFRAKIYYEGFEPAIDHPSIEWIKYEDAIPNHPEWKTQYLAQTTHNDYMQTMAVKFSHKAFVIQHVLDSNSDDYLIWLDGDCVFKNADYTHFPKDILGDKFLACQVEHNHNLNHVESGILIFNGKHQDKIKFNEEFKKWYLVKNILPMKEPYDGFIVYKSLLTSGLKYVNLNEKHGRGGIQSDPNMTFCHPDIRNKFIHNIGWAGKSQYEAWQQIYERDDVYRKMSLVLFGNSKGELLAKKKRTRDKLQKLKKVGQ